MPLINYDCSAAVALGRRALGLSPSRTRAVVDYAKAIYVHESVYHDPGLTKGIDNILLLLLNYVAQVNEEGRTLPDNIGLGACDRLLERIGHFARLPRSVRRWLGSNQMLFVLLAEHMAWAMKQEKLPEVPSHPIYGIPRWVQVEGPSEKSEPVFLQVAGSEVGIGRARSLGAWKMSGFIDQPLPDWWHGLNRRWPSRAAVYLDRIAHEILTPDSS